MRKCKSIEKFERLSKQVARGPHLFQITADSSPRKVARWLRRGGGAPMVRSPEKMAIAHHHPRSLRGRL